MLRNSHADSVFASRTTKEKRKGDRLPLSSKTATKRIVRQSIHVTCFYTMNRKAETEFFGCGGGFCNWFFFLFLFWYMCVPTTVLVTCVNFCFFIELDELFSFFHPNILLHINLCSILFGSLKFGLKLFDFYPRWRRFAQASLYFGREFVALISIIWLVNHCNYSFRTKWKWMQRLNICTNISVFPPSFLEFLPLASCTDVYRAYYLMI